MESIFVRKCHRRNGFGIHMLKDFVLSFEDDYLGLRYPLTKAMYKMCEKYLHQFPADADLFWEVEGEGRPNQRFNIASKVQTMALTETPYEVTKEAEKEVTIAAQIKAAESIVYTIEIADKVLVGGATADTEETPVGSQSRSSAQKPQKKADKIQRNAFKKVDRRQYIEAQTPHEHTLGEWKITSFSDEAVTKGIVNMLAEEKGKNDIAIAEVAEISTILIPREDEDVTELAAEVCQDRENLTQACDNSHIGNKNMSEMEGTEEVTQEKEKAIEEMDLASDQNIGVKADFLSEVSDDDDQDGSTLLPLSGLSNDQVNPVKAVHEEEGKRTADELSSLGRDGAPRTGEDEARPFLEDNLQDRKKDKITKGMAEAVIVEAEHKESDRDNLTHELDTSTVSLENSKTDEYLIDPAETEASQEGVTDLPKLREARVILVDVKTAHHPLSEKEVEKSPATEASAELLIEETGPEVKKEKDVPICIEEEPLPEKSETALEKNGQEEPDSPIYMIREMGTYKLKYNSSEKQNEENVNEVEVMPVDEVRVLRSGRKKVGTSKTEKPQEEDKLLPVKDFNEDDSIMIEEEAAVLTKDTEKDKHTATSLISVSLKDDKETVTTMETNSVSMIVTSNYELQAENPVPPRVQETEPTAAQEQSEEMVSEILDLKTIAVVVVDQGVQEKLLPKIGGQLEEVTGKETTAEKHVTESDIEREECTEETLYAHDGKVEENDEFIQDEQQMCGLDSSPEEIDVELQIQSIDLKTNGKKENTVTEDCLMEQEDLQDTQKEEHQATEQEVAANIPEEGSTLKDPTQESMKTQASTEQTQLTNEQTQSVLASVPSGDSVQEIQVEKVTKTVDQSFEVRRSGRKRADLGNPVEERLLRKKRKCSALSTIQHKPQRAWRWHHSQKVKKDKIQLFNRK
ncbi:uncharacterized protein fam169ab isoform X2 [Corythoichthys intestinalis]|nr:uncharacterized protein fam169ab isoform X2 [Corythoichthys intestinalis]